MAWHFLFGRRGGRDDLDWHTSSGSGTNHNLPDVEGVMIAILFAPAPWSKFAAVEYAKELVRNTTPLSWLIPNHSEWVINLDEMKGSVEAVRNLDWLRGTYYVEPEYERRRFDVLDGGEFHGALTFYLTADVLGGSDEPTDVTSSFGYEERWEIVEELGEGGQGKVHLVRDKDKCESRTRISERIANAVNEITQNRTRYARQSKGGDLIMAIEKILDGEEAANQAALKVLHEPTESRDPETAEERIKREIEAMSNISHPNLIRVVDKNIDEMWFVSEYHPKGKLDDKQQLFAGNVEAALRSIRPIVEGVAHLHDQGIVHRDIKPGNIFVAADDRLILGDFGLVFFTDPDRTRVSPTLDNVGSWEWMPAWAQGVRIEDITPGFDVFSLGKVLWWMVSGKPIQELRLWYFRDQSLNVEKLFATAPNIRLLNPLLAKCVVERKEDCLSDARELLEEIDRSLSIIDKSADLMDSDVPRSCKVCGLGTYRKIDDENVLEKFGVRPNSRHPVEAFGCDKCGHAQVFIQDSVTETDG